MERRAEEEGHAGVGEVGKEKKGERTEGGGREGRKENKIVQLYLFSLHCEFTLERYVKKKWGCLPFPQVATILG